MGISHIHIFQRPLQIWPWSTTAKEGPPRRQSHRPQRIMDEGDVFRLSEPRNIPREDGNLWNSCPVRSANCYVPAMCVLSFPFQMAVVIVIILFLLPSVYAYILLAAGGGKQITCFFSFTSLDQYLNFM